MPTTKDYYSILGVSKNASADEIKSAHRKLVRKLHPDVNDAPDAEERFREVQEAYDILSDEQKRSLYDRVGHEAFTRGASDAAGSRGKIWIEPRKRGSRASHFSATRSL